MTQHLALVLALMLPILQKRRESVIRKLSGTANQQFTGIITSSTFFYQYLSYRGNLSKYRLFELLFLPVPTLFLGLGALAWTACRGEPSH